MEKIYSQINLPDEILKKIRGLNTESAISNLKLILENDDAILLPRRIEMFSELIPDKKRAESLAVSTCKSWRFKVQDKTNSQKNLKEAHILRINPCRKTKSGELLFNIPENETQLEINGKRVHCSIDKNGDMIKRVYLQIVFDNLETQHGNSFIESVCKGGVPYETVYFQDRKEIKYVHGNTLSYEKNAIDFAKKKINAIHVHLPEKN